MTYHHPPEFQDGRPTRSARERAELHRESLIREQKQLHEKGGVTSMDDLRELAIIRDRLFMLDLVWIVFDAMTYGVDGKRPEKTQMQEQGPPGGFPHTGLPPERSPTFKVGQAVCITAVPPSHNHPGLPDMHGLIGRGATIVEVEPVQNWMTEPWYRLR